MWDDTVGKPSSSSNFSIRASRAYPLVEVRQTVLCRAIRGDSISVNSTLLPLNITYITYVHIYIYIYIHRSTVTSPPLRCALPHAGRGGQREAMITIILIIIIIIIRIIIICFMIYKYYLYYYLLLLMMYYYIIYYVLLV